MPFHIFNLDEKDNFLSYTMFKLLYTTFDKKPYLFTFYIICKLWMLDTL